MHTTHSTPCPQAPGALIGYRSNGRPIYLAAGGAPDDGAGGQGGAGDGTGQQAAGAAGGGQGGTDAGQAGNGQQQAGQQAGEWDGKVESLPAAAQQLIASLRQENGNARTTAKQQAADEARQQLTKDIAKALGIATDGDQAPDPAKLTEQVSAAQAQARTAAVELAVYRAAGKHQGDPDALLDSRTFLAKVNDLDPTAADFATKVDDAIKTAVAGNAKLKLAQAAGSSSVDHAGGSGEQRTSKPGSLADAVAGHYGTAT